MFEKMKYLFDNNKIYELLTYEESTKWLKLRAISRKELLKNFCKSYNIIIKSTKVSDIFEELFYKLEDHSIIDNFIKSNLKLLTPQQENYLVSELYKIKYFDWGGDYKNALDRFIIDKFIKKYDTYEEISKKLKNEINQAVHGYVQCSWYNHWTTILAENIFKQHKNVIPAIGEIKQIDFFINDIPFDLKTTYLPANFVDKERKKHGLLSETNEYKKIAKDFQIDYDEKNIIYEVREKGIHLNKAACYERINQIDSFKHELLNQCKEKPSMLIQNLYEEQGESRFNASNRLFLILVDTNDFENSWKLKRDINLLRNEIFSYLDSFDKEKLLNNPIRFKYKYKGEEIFNVYSDCIFIIRKKSQ